MTRLIASIALILTALPALASATCDPSQIAGRWNVRATGAQTASAGYVEFTADQKIHLDLIGSARGSAPGELNFPSGAYPLAWQASDASATGLCVIDTTYSHDGITERWTIRYPGASKPRTLTGVGAVTAPGLALTMQVAFVRE